MNRMPGEFEASPVAEIGDHQETATNSSGRRRRGLGRYSLRTILALLVVASLAAFASSRLLRSSTPKLPARSEIASITIEGHAVPEENWEELLSGFRLENVGDERFQSDVLIAQGSLDIHRKGRPVLRVYLDYDEGGRIWVTLFDSESRKGSLSLAATPKKLDRAFHKAFENTFVGGPAD